MVVDLGYQHPGWSMVIGWYGQTKCNLTHLKGVGQNVHAHHFECFLKFLQPLKI